MFMVFLELAMARGTVAFFGHMQLYGLSTFAVNLLTMVAIAAATDYVIFLFGRYQEARKGRDSEDAYYEMFHGTSHVILGSGLTIAGAMFCLHFTRLPMFQSMGIPLAVGMVVVVGAALTLGPAIVVVASHFGRLEPKRAVRERFWRRIAAAGPVARPDSDRDDRAMSRRTAGAARLPDRLQRPPLPTAGHPRPEGFAAAERHSRPPGSAPRS